MNKFYFLIILGFALGSCQTENNSNNDKVKVIDKDGSIEAQISVKHLSDTKDVLYIERKTWIHNQIIKDVTTTDTVPSLGQTREVGENSDGNDTTVTVKKNYQIFITVK
jgi:formylmethanofuran dehydrogenase subunit D